MGFGVCRTVTACQFFKIELQHPRYLPSEIADAFRKVFHAGEKLPKQLALSGSKNIRSKLKAIKDLGIKLAMDDFGMGHSSLMYLKEYEFDTIKLDGALIREIMTNHTCSDIIYYLSRS
ncbi:MAG: EAL domain-containing protein [Peptococcaceae bacterium]|nr:EAL domain-containing protein [Peptococcaceae bacterium]